MEPNPTQVSIVSGNLILSSLSSKLEEVHDAKDHGSPGSASCEYFRSIYTCVCNQTEQLHGEL